MITIKGVYIFIFIKYRIKKYGSCRSILNTNIELYISTVYKNPTHIAARIELFMCSIILLILKMLIKKKMQLNIMDLKVEFCAFYFE